MSVESRDRIPFQYSSVSKIGFTFTSSRFTTNLLFVHAEQHETIQDMTELYWNGIRSRDSTDTHYLVFYLE